MWGLFADSAGSVNGQLTPRQKLHGRLAWWQTAAHFMENREKGGAEPKIHPSSLGPQWLASSDQALPMNIRDFERIFQS